VIKRLNIKIFTVFGDSNELLGQITSSINGTFEVSGSTREFTSIDPKLIVYPNCIGKNEV
jgi:hypothetical protein